MKETKMKKYITQHRWLHLAIISAVLIATMGFAPTGVAQAACDPLYTVQRGDTLSSIARECGTTLSALLRANPQISNPSRIFPGEQVYLPGATFIDPDTGKPVYIVKSGDTMSAIAVRFDTTLATLLKLNPKITNARLIFPGQRLNLPSGTIPDTGASNNPERISFPNGGTWAVVTGKLAADSSDSYLLRAAKNQLLEVNLSPEDDVQLSIHGADGTVLKKANRGGTSFRGTLPSTQDYILKVSAEEKTTYTMNVDIPARISFAPGAISGTVTGRVAAEGSQYYILGALKNQKLEVQVSPEDKLEVVIYGVDGTVLKSGMSEGSSFSGKLPRSQDYIIGLSAGDKAVNFSMKVTIPTSGTTDEGQTIYVVQRGDWLAKIARHFGTTVSELLEANPQITDPSLIFPGQRIVIP
jgi:LysM repeat protein